MIKFENTEVIGWEAAIRGMRNPLNSWEKSDSGYKCPYLKPEVGHTPSCCRENMCIGPNDLDLMKRLRNAGTDHQKFMRMITVYVDITAPIYWWTEFDTYKDGTVVNSCSSMHKIAAKRFEREDFSVEHLKNWYEEHWTVCMDNVIASLNVAREKYLETKDKKYWWQMIQLLPSSYNQKRTVMMNYEVLANVYKSRKDHKLDEWCEHESVTITYKGKPIDKINNQYFGFCDWIKTLPYSELITGKE